MMQRLPRRGVLLLAVGGLVASCAAAAARFLGGIGIPPPAGRWRGNPDPGNRRLDALAADPAFARLPPGAVRTGWQENPARYQSGVFAGAGWHGPSVILTFTSPQSVLDVYRFYAERAHQAGWTPWQKLSNGFTRSWSKHIAGSSIAKPAPLKTKSLIRPIS